METKVDLAKLTVIDFVMLKSKLMSYTDLVCAFACIGHSVHVQHKSSGLHCILK